MLNYQRVGTYQMHFRIMCEVIRYCFLLPIESNVISTFGIVWNTLNDLRLKSNSYLSNYDFLVTLTGAIIRKAWSYRQEKVKVVKFQDIS